MTRHKKKPGGKMPTTEIQSLITKQYTKDPKKRFNAKQLHKKLKIAASVTAVAHAMNKLVEEGFLYEIKDGRFKLNNRMSVEKASEILPQNSFIGKVDMTRSGAAYVISEESDLDIFVHARNTNGAMDGDIVKVKVSKVPGRKKPEGKITDIIKRKTTHILGILHKYHRYASVVPMPHDRSPEVHVKMNDVEAVESGTPVVVEITDWGISQNKAIWGKITKVLENASNNDVAMMGIIQSAGFDEEFPEDVLKELNDIDGKITQQEIDRRRDFRKVTTVTIDPLTAKDFDDAISIEYLEDDKVEIGVHIADVTHYVKEGSYLDKEALERSTSVYLVDRVIPMLPEKLSNDLCSLNPNEDKLVFSASFVFDKSMKLLDSWFGKAIIHSDKRFVYEEAQEILNAGEGDYFKELELLDRIAKKLKKKRFKYGSLAFESEEVYFELDEDSVPIAVKTKERQDTHMLVEDFMLLANRKVAEFIKKKSKREIPFVYRVHDSPDQDKLADFALFAKALGVEMKIDTPKDVAASFNKLSIAAKENPQLKLLEPLAIRTMAKAVYSSDNIGHYGLAFEDYTHFTSPIRRYADVLVHRILDKNLDAEYRVDKDKLEAKCKHISEQEKKASDAERESIKYKQVEFIKNHVGEEMPGVISGMIDRGLFVLLKPSHAEGMVSFETLDDSFEVAESRLYATGRRTRKVFKMGQEVKVLIVDADLDMRQIELELLDI